MKRKKGFTLIEISLLIFVMLIIMAIVLPFSFSNTKEAHLITKWERIFEEVKYSFSVYSLNNRNVFDIIRLSPDNCILILFLLQFLKIFHSLGFEEFVDATQVFFYALVSELVNLGN